MNADVSSSRALIAGSEPGQLGLLQKRPRREGYTEARERKCAEPRQQLLYEVALVLAGADSLSEAAPKILCAVCRAFDWAFGELWRVDRARRVLRNVCTSSPSGITPSRWAKITASATFAPGVGIPGRVWDSRQPLYTVALTRDSNCPRAAAARQAGLRSAFGFPILLHGTVLGVMAFFCREPRPVEEDSVAFFATLGSQLGQFIERRRAEKALRQSEANLASAQQIAHVGSFDMNVAGTGTDHWSVELFRILGLDPADPALSPEEYIHRIVHPADQARVRETFGRCVSQGVNFNHEYRIVRPNGALRHVHSIAHPVLGPDNRTARVVGVLHDVSERKRLEQAVWETSEREHRRIGQDLHDSLGQQLTAIELMCQSLQHDLSPVQPALARQAARIGHFLRQAISQTRTLAHGLTAHNVETGGLPQALADLAQTTSSLGRLKCRLECPAAVTLEESAIAVHLYRIAQEAVNNAMKHSRARAVVVRLERLDGVLRLLVADNGRGLPRTQVAEQGMGMQVMRHRAGMIGAELEVLSRAGKGVTVSCTLRRKV